MPALLYNGATYTRTHTYRRTTSLSLYPQCFNHCSNNSSTHPCAQTPHSASTAYTSKYVGRNILLSLRSQKSETIKVYKILGCTPLLPDTPTRPAASSSSTPTPDIVIITIAAPTMDYPISNIKRIYINRKK